MKMYRVQMKNACWVIASFEDREQLVTVPKLESSSGKHQVTSVSTALFVWNLHDKVQIMCCDTTANTGRFNGACAILEQTLGRELLLFFEENIKLRLPELCIRHARWRERSILKK